MEIQDPMRLGLRAMSAVMGRSNRRRTSRGFHLLISLSLGSMVQRGSESSWLYFGVGQPLTLKHRTRVPMLGLASRTELEGRQVAAKKRRRKRTATMKALPRPHSLLPCDASADGRCIS